MTQYKDIVEEQKEKLKEEQLDKDRERSKNAHNFQIIQITMGEPMEHPYAQFTMTAEVIYTYTTGDT